MKRLIAFCLMFCVGAIPAMPLDASEVVVEENQEKDAKREAAIKAKIEQMELGQKVKLKLVSDQEIKGKIQSIASDGFAISNAETSQIEKILFSDVTEIRKDKMRGWVKALIIVGAAWGAAVIFIVASGVSG